MGNPQLEDGFIRISTELWDALCRIRINGEARQVLDFIIRKTYGWNKTKDNISFSQIELGTGINRRNSIRAIEKLLDMNIIGVEKDTSKGNIYWINKKYLTWLPSVKKDTVVSKTTQGSVKTCKKVVSKTTHTIDTIQKTNTIDKDIPATTSSKTKPEHTKFIEQFASDYETHTKNPYKINWAKESKLVTDLIKEYGIDTLNSKKEALLKACKDKSLWFTKNEGMASFKIGALSTHFNALIIKSNTQTEFDRLSNLSTEEYLKLEREKNDRKEL